MEYRYTMVRYLKRLELYLYLFLTAAVWIIPTSLQYILGYSGQFAASSIALPFLGWVVLSAYYLLRWTARRVRSASKQA